MALVDAVLRLCAGLEALETPGAVSPPSDADQRSAMGRDQLVVVGTGIRAAGQLTFEAAACMVRAERLFYSVADPATDAVVRALNPAAEPLMQLYAEGTPRSETYQHMVATILDSVRGGSATVAAFYGHPGVFAWPAHEAIRQARAEGLSARMLPGVSAEDCLFADLGVDPAACGCQSLEASDFLLRLRSLDVSQPLVLWQIGVVGEWVFRREQYVLRALPLLVRKLLESYPGTHPAVVYEAARVGTDAPRVSHVRIGELPGVPLTPVSTLYVPPLTQAPFDLAYATQLPLPASAPMAAR